MIGVELMGDYFLNLVTTEIYLITKDANLIAQDKLMVGIAQEETP